MVLDGRHKWMVAKMVENLGQEKVAELEKALDSEKTEQLNDFGRKRHADHIAQFRRPRS
jgi:hypothetical protein